MAGTPEEIARRAYAAQRDPEIQKALAGNPGSIDDILSGLGIHDTQGEGRAKYQEYKNFYTQYGMGASPQNNYDWANGVKYDPLYGTEGTDDAGNPTYERGKWVPITPEEQKSHDDMQAMNDKYGEGNFNPWRIERMKYDLNSGYGHLERDAQGRYFHDDGKTRTYYDDKYQPIGTEPSKLNQQPKPPKVPPTTPGVVGAPEASNDPYSTDLAAANKAAADKAIADKAINDAALKPGPSTVGTIPTVSPTAAPRPGALPQTQPWTGTGVVNSSNNVNPSRPSVGVSTLDTPSNSINNPLTRNITQPAPSSNRTSMFNSQNTKPKKPGVPGFSL